MLFTQMARRPLAVAVFTLFAFTVVTYGGSQSPGFCPAPAVPVPLG